MAKLSLEIVTPEKRVLQKEVDEVVALGAVSLPGAEASGEGVDDGFEAVAPWTEGYFGVRPGHAPLLAEMRPSALYATDPGQGPELRALPPGLASMLQGMPSGVAAEFVSSLSKLELEREDVVRWLVTELPRIVRELYGFSAAPSDVQLRERLARAQNAFPREPVLVQALAKLEPKLAVALVASRDDIQRTLPRARTEQVELARKLRRDQAAEVEALRADRAARLRTVLNSIVRPEHIMALAARLPALAELVSGGSSEVVKRVTEVATDDLAKQLAQAPTIVAMLEDFAKAVEKSATIDDARLSALAPMLFELLPSLPAAIRELKTPKRAAAFARLLPTLSLRLPEVSRELAEALDQAWSELGERLAALREKQERAMEALRVRYHDSLDHTIGDLVREAHAETFVKALREIGATYRFGMPLKWRIGERWTTGYVGRGVVMALDDKVSVMADWAVAQERAL